MNGRPFLGLVAGFLFGLFGGITLFMYGVIPLHSNLIWILPLLGLLLGLILAAWAPFEGTPAPDAGPPTEMGPGGELIDHNPPFEEPSPE
ncbi:MAG: hypothetical protein ABFR95_05560 [Actinomycetota bacterium]